MDDLMSVLLPFLIQGQIDLVGFKPGMPKILLNGANSAFSDTGFV